MRKLIPLLLLPVLLLGQTRQKPMTSPPQVGTTSSTGPHQATINWSNASCTSTAPCSIQVYRSVCTSATTCPAYSTGNSSWTVLNMSCCLSPAISANGTSWQYIDKDVALQDSTTYAWVATNTFTGGSVASGASSNFVGTTNNGTPAAPTLASSGNSVN